MVFSDEGQNEMQTAWNGHLAVASMVPNVTFLLLNAAFGHYFPTKPRLLVSLCFVILLFMFTDAMAKTDTDPWQEAFYYVTLISVVFININSAIFQGNENGGQKSYCSLKTRLYVKVSIL